MRWPEANQPEPDLPPEIVAEVASLLARGYLRYRRSLRHFRRVSRRAVGQPAVGRRSPAASRPSPRPHCMSPTVTRDSGNLRISRVGHPRYSGRHPLPASQKTKQRTDASYISNRSYYFDT